MLTTVSVTSSHIITEGQVLPGQQTQKLWYGTVLGPHSHWGLCCRQQKETYLVGGRAHVQVPDLPGQRKQYSRAPNTHCSTVPAARARLSVVGWMQDTLSLLQAHGQLAWQSPPSRPLNSARVALTRLRPCPGEGWTASPCPPTYLLLRLLGEPTRGLLCWPPPSTFPAKGWCSASCFEPCNTPKHELLLHPFGANEGGGRTGVPVNEESLCE